MTGATNPTTTRAPRRAEDRDEEGHQERAEADRQGAEALQDAEHPGQHLAGGHPGDEGEGRDVDHGVAEADDRRGEQGEDVVRQQPHQRQRQAPEDDGDAEPPRHRPAADQQRAGHAPDQRADADGSLDHADARLATLEEVDRDDHDEDAERSPDHRLEHHEPEHHVDAVVGADAGETVPDVGEEGTSGTGGARHPRVVQPDQERSRDQPAGTGEHEHGGHVVDGHQQRRHQRADDHAERVQPATQDVHRRELVGGAAEQGHQGRVARPVRREGDSWTRSPGRRPPRWDRRRPGPARLRAWPAPGPGWTRPAAAPEGPGRRTPR